MPPGPAPLSSGTGGLFYEAPRMKTMSGLLIGSLLLLIVTSTAFSQSLKSRRDYVVGDHPVGVVATDFDNDGFLDLITVDQQTAGSGDIALMKGFGDGTFRKVTGVLSGAHPSAMSYVDVNADGKPDLVVANLTSQEVAVHLGNGTGGFGAKISTPIVGTPSGLATGDWNGDGKVDVAVLNGAFPDDAADLRGRFIVQKSGHGRFQPGRQGRPRGGQQHGKHPADLPWRRH